MSYSVHANSILAGARRGFSEALFKTSLSPTYFAIRDFNIEHGRILSDDDCDAAARVAVLGPTTAKNLFGDNFASAVGESIEVERELVGRGFSEETAALAISEVGPEGEENALARLFARLRRSTAGVPAEVRRRRVWSALTRRGFPAAAISAKMKNWPGGSGDREVRGRAEEEEEEETTS